MSNLPQLNKKYLIIGIIAILIIVGGGLLAWRTITKQNQNQPTTGAPTNKGLAANLPQLESSIETRTLLAEQMLGWFDTTLNAEGVYLTDLACDANSEATGSACTAYNDDFTGGLSIIWARWKLHNQFLNEDLNAYLAKMQQADAAASDSGNLAHNNLPICSLMQDIANDENLDRETRALAFNICFTSQTVKPSSVLNKDDYQFPNSAVDDWATYLTENALQGNGDLVLDNLADFAAVLENTRGQRGLTAKNQCLLALLTENLPTDASGSAHVGILNDFVGKYRTSYFTTEKIDPFNRDTLATCAIASSHSNFNRQWLHEQIYNLHQNQAAEFGLNATPLPFLSGVANNQKPWLVNTWFNGLLIGGLVDY